MLPVTKQRGFTIVELVAVIVILGVLGVGASQFIRQGVGIYVDTVRRDNLQQQSRFAIERISRELKQALPGSIRTSSDVNSQCIEFVPIVAASTYLNPVAGVGNITSLELVDVGYNFNNGDSLVIYPLDQERVYGSIAKPSGNRVAIASESAGAQANTRSLTFSATAFDEESPNQRVYIISTPVSFCARDNSLTRHSNYNYSINQLLLPGDEVPLAEYIRLDDDGTYALFDYMPDSLQRAAIINLDLRFFDGSESDEWLRMIREVSLRNTP